MMQSWRLIQLFQIPESCLLVQTEQTSSQPVPSVIVIIRMNPCICKSSQELIPLILLVMDHFQSFQIFALLRARVNGSMLLWHPSWVKLRRSLRKQGIVCDFEPHDFEPECLLLAPKKISNPSSSSGNGSYKLSGAPVIHLTKRQPTPIHSQPVASGCAT